jgi:hypothetical protein
MSSPALDISSPSTGVYLCISASILLLIVVRQNKSHANILYYLGAFFALFAFGPAANYVLGNPIYFGIRQDYIGGACFGFLLALAGLVTANAVVVRRRSAPAGFSGPARRYDLYPPLMVVVILYGLIVIVRLLPELTGSKSSQVALAGPGHSVYLLVELCVVPTYFLTRRTRLLRGLWLGNAVVYVAYCLAASERDFLFAFFSVLLHRYVVIRRAGRSVRVALAGMGAVVLAALLFADRSGQGLDVAGVLNQGSLLFVDSFVQEWVSQHGVLRYGATYVNAILSLPPSWIYDSGLPNLSSWLVSLYAPGSSAGYGFSLSAEAYLNFGFAGIFVIFFLIGLSVRAAVARFGRSDWGTFFSVYYLAIVMYAVRGDSSQLLKSVVYGSIFFAAISLTSSVEVAKNSATLPGHGSDKTTT